MKCPSRKLTIINNLFICTMFTLPIIFSRNTRVMANLCTYLPKAGAVKPILSEYLHHNSTLIPTRTVTNGDLNNGYQKTSEPVKNDNTKMVDPKRVVSYEDMLKVINEPKKVIIDVRTPEEVNSTGMIPSSINIPLNNVQNALVSMSDEEFRQQYQRKKPTVSDELIFYCRSGRRSTEALDKALKLGYTNSKTYLGSWTEWSNKRK